MTRPDGLATGCLIGAGFGLVFVLANAGPFSTATTRSLVLAALVMAAAVVVGSLTRHPAAGARQADFGHGYRTVVAAEVVAVVAGSLVLNVALGEHRANVAWIALVVGVHFFFLARLWHTRRLAVMGALLALCGAVGIGLAVSAAPLPAVAAVGAMAPGFVLLATSAYALVADRPGHVLHPGR